MKNLRRVFAAFAVSALVATSASALSITPAEAVLSGTDTSQAAIDVLIELVITPAPELYKMDVGAAGDVGALAGSYSTTFDNEPDDPAEFTITYDGGDIVGPTAWLLVKGGGPDQFVGDLWYLFNLTNLGWTGTETIEGTEFWPDQGAVSHVTLYGTRGTSVPDGGLTLALLGLSLMGLAGASRRFGKSS